MRPADWRDNGEETIMAVIPGGPGDDILPGTPDPDTIDGFDGNDRITAGEGDDNATGGRGNDVINGEGGNDTLYGNGGSDIISGGTGNDTIYAGGGADTVQGGDGDDSIYDIDSPGFPGSGGGVDRFEGGIGNDSFFIDRLNPSTLQETIVIIGDPDPTVTGNDLVDYRSARRDIATVNLGGGADTFILRDTGGGHVDLSLGTGPEQDRIVFMDATPGSAGQAGLVVTQFGAEGAQFLRGLDVIDLSPLLASLTNWDGANPFLTGHFRLVQAGNNVLLQADFDGVGAGSFATLAQFNGLTVAQFGESNFINIPQGGVTRVGDAGDNVLNGSAFDDSLTGAGGNDELYGFADDDVLNGNDGNDLLDGGAGADTMTGGIGDDTYFVDNIGDVVIEGVNGGTDRVVSSINYTLGANVEQLDLRGGNGLAVIGTGNNLDNNIQGNAQNNSLIGGGGNDLLAGGEGNDTLNGGGGNDALLGNDGNDVLNGGPGLDMLDGGAGADRYVFIPSGMSMTQVDRVYFSADDGDVIDLSLLDAVTGGGDSAFSFIGTDAFTGVAGELRYELIGTWDEGPRSGTTYYVSGDINGDGVADFMIEISMLGPQPIDAGDFIL